MKRACILSLFVVVGSLARVSNAQVPPPALRNVTVKASVSYDPATKIFTYRYAVTNPASNVLPVDMLQVDVTLSPGTKVSEGTDPLPKGDGYLDPWQAFPPLEDAPFPERSVAEAQENRTGLKCIRVGLSCPAPWQHSSAGPVYAYRLLGSVCAASWSRNLDDVTPRILPGQTLAGFELTTYGLPGIRSAEAETNITELADAGRLPPEWTEADDDTEKEIVAKLARSELLNCKTTTIGPVGLSPFTPLGFSQTIREYLNRSVQLGWLIDTALSATLTGHLDQLDALLAQKKYPQAAAAVQSFEDAVRGATAAQRSPEADALLYYNAEFLRTQILQFIPLAWSLTPSENTHSLNEVQVFEVRTTRGPDPETYMPFLLAIDSGPHSPQEIVGRTDVTGRWTWQYVGTKVGVDHVKLLPPPPLGLAKPDSHPEALSESGDALAEARVTWIGGPDLTLGHLFPPALKIPSGKPTVTIDESTVNVGTTGSTPTTTQYYLSRERKVDDTSVVFGRRSVPALAPGEESRGGVTVDVPKIDPGIYWIMACANSVDPIAELNYDNNCQSLRVDVVHLVGTSNLPPVCSAALASPSQIWPPNHKMVPITIEGVTDPDGDPVSIQVTSIRQDEPVNGEGDGDSSPDATLYPLQLRAERSGAGNGRVYHIGFTATDGKGGSCNGDVAVCVPDDEGKKLQCVDDGARYDSTVK